MTQPTPVWVAFSSDPCVILKAICTGVSWVWLVRLSLELEGSIQEHSEDATRISHPLFNERVE